MQGPDFHHVTGLLLFSPPNLAISLQLNLCPFSKSVSEVEKLSLILVLVSLPRLYANDVYPPLTTQVFIMFS